MDRLPPHRRPARAGREVDVEPVPVRLPHGLEGAGAVVRRADRKKKIPPFFHQIEDYATLTFVGPDATTAKPFGIDEARAADDLDGRRLPGPAAAVSRDAAHPKLQPEFPICVAADPGQRPDAAHHAAAAYGPTDAVRGSRTTPERRQGRGEADGHAATAAPPTTSRSTRSSPRTATSTSAGTATPTGEKRKCTQITRYTMTHEAAVRPRPQEREDDHRVGVRRPQRRARCASATTACCTSPPATAPPTPTRTSPASTPTCCWPRCCASTSTTPPTGKTYCVPKDNPFVGDKRFVPETWAYGLRNPWRITLDAKTGPTLGRAERAGPVGAGVPRQEGRQLRLERDGGQPPVLPDAQGRADADRQADRRAPPLRGAVAHRRHRLPRREAARSCRARTSTATTPPARSGGEARRREDRVAQGDRRSRTLKITAFALDPRRRVAHLRPRRDRRRRVLHARAEPARRTPARSRKKLSDSGLFDVGEGPRDEAGRDPVLGERAVLVGRAAQGAVPRAAGGRGDRATSATAAGTSRTRRCS